MFYLCFWTPIMRLFLCYSDFCFSKKYSHKPLIMAFWMGLDIIILLQWNPSIPDSAGTKIIVRFRGGSSLQRNRGKLPLGTKAFVQYIENSSILRVRCRRVPLFHPKNLRIFLLYFYSIHYGKNNFMDLESIFALLAEQNHIIFKAIS